MISGLSFLNAQISFFEVFTSPISLVESVLFKKIQAGTK